MLYILYIYIFIYIYIYIYLYIYIYIYIITDHRSTAVIFRTVLKYSEQTYVFYPKTSNFHNSGMNGRKNLSDPSMNKMFDVLSIGLQYTLSFKLQDFGLTCLVTITPKG